MPKEVLFHTKSKEFFEGSWWGSTVIKKGKDLFLNIIYSKSKYEYDKTHLKSCY